MLRLTQLGNGISHYHILPHMQIDRSMPSRDTQRAKLSISLGYINPTKVQTCRHLLTKFVYRTELAIHQRHTLDTVPIRLLEVKALEEVYLTPPNQRLTYPSRQRVISCASSSLHSQKLVHNVSVRSLNRITILHEP